MTDGPAGQARGLGAFDGIVARLDRFTLPLLLALAALLRSPNLIARGSWEADQGRDMLILRAMVRDGVVPLVGPPTSIGELHHGPWFYYLLSPAAALTGGDSPLAVTALIALAGIATVAVVWWLARQAGGPIAGAVAGLAAAVSVAAIESSTFIWSPNFIGLTSALSLAATWRAWSGGDRRWWLVAALGLALTMQFHVLGVALLPIVGVPFVADARRRRLGSVSLGVVAILAASFVPLLVNELATGGSEIRAALGYLASDRPSSELPIPVRFAMVGLRMLSWPLTGLITEGFVPGVIASAAVIAIAVVRSRAGGLERLAARWLGLGLLWSAAFLTVTAPSLATVVTGLANDHYHAFAGPMVFTLVGLGAAALVRAPGGHGDAAAARVGPILAVIVVAALLGWNLSHLPPATHSDGGFPAAERAERRVETTLSDAGIGSDAVLRIRSLPSFKSTEAMAYPLVRTGRPVVADTPAGTITRGAAAVGREPSALVLLCDDRFREAIGAACGGPAESTIVPDGGGSTWGPLLDRFEAAPDRFVSVYGPPEDPG